MRLILISISILSLGRCECACLDRCALKLSRTTMPQVFNEPPRAHCGTAVEVWPNNSKRTSSVTSAPFIDPIMMRTLFMIFIILVKLNSDIGQLLLHQTRHRHSNYPGLVSALGQVQPNPANNNQSNSSTGRPHWHRPGCYQVGK